MNKEFLKMQKLAGLITESQFKQLVENGTITYKGPTEDSPYRKEIYRDNKPLLTAETSQEEQGKISIMLKGENIIDQMYEPSQLADVLGYDSVKELAQAIAEKTDAQFSEDINEVRTSYRPGDDIFDVIYMDIISPDEDDYYMKHGRDDAYPENDTLGIGFKTGRTIGTNDGKGYLDHTEEQKENYLKYLKKKADEGNEKAIELFRIAKTLPEVQPLLKQLGFN